MAELATSEGGGSASSCLLATDVSVTNSRFLVCGCHVESPFFLHDDRNTADNNIPGNVRQNRCESAVVQC